ncbi:MAG: serine/threonine protein kinase, partial [bacterium]
IIDAATGKLVTTQKLGRVMFGSLVAGDGKIYAAENTGRFYVYKQSEKGVETVSQARLGQGEEVFGSPVISNGRIYLPTIEALYCIGSKDAAATPPGDSGAVAAKKEVTDRKVTQILLTPTELLLKPGEKVALKVSGYNAIGQYVGPVKDAVVTVQGGGSVSK